MEKTRLRAHLYDSTAVSASEFRSQDLNWPLGVGRPHDQPHIAKNRQKIRHSIVRKRAAGIGNSNAWANFPKIR